MKKLSPMKSKKNAIYARKSFAEMKKRIINLNYTKKSQIIVILQEMFEELLIIFAI